MGVEEVLESLRLHIRVSRVVKIIGDVSLPVDAVVLVEAVASNVNLEEMLRKDVRTYKESHAKTLEGSFLKRPCMWV